MTDDKTLADRVNDLGADIAIEGSFTPDEFYHRLVRDWRVAGALMEKCAFCSIVAHAGSWVVTAHNYRQVADDIGDSLPRAIVEACVRALEGSDD